MNNTDSRNYAPDNKRNKSGLKQMQALSLILAVTVTLVAGMLVLYKGKAATTAIKTEAESGTLGAGASLVQDSGASGGQAIAFSAVTTGGTGLESPDKKEIAMRLVSSAENSSTNWKAQYKYIEDIGDGRGYTAGIIGFCSGTHDMLEMIRYYSQIKPGNILEKYLPALEAVDGTDSHDGLSEAFEDDWVTAAADPMFQKAQNDERDRVYFNPSVAQAKADGLRTLGQFIYYDAIVMHGDGNWPESFRNIRANALKNAKPPAQGGNETTYLNAFLNARVVAMKAEEAHEDTSRVDTAQRKFLNESNFELTLPLQWAVYGQQFSINSL